MMICPQTKADCPYESNCSVVCFRDCTTSTTKAATERIKECARSTLHRLGWTHDAINIAISAKEPQQ